MKKIFALFLGMSILLSGCGTGLFAEPTSTPTMTFTPPPPTEAERATPTQTFTITPTFTASPSPTPTWVHQGPESVEVPILLYHWIAVSPDEGTNYKSPYYVKPEVFDAEMKLLHDWGYTTITTEMLIKAIREGADLPPRPVIITFDDGHMNNYTNAFPIMQKYGFTGVLYLVANYLDAEDYLTVDQIKEMAAAGWEIGSHSVSHSDLTSLEPERQRFEVVDSRAMLESKLGVPVLTIAYPFGVSNSSVIDYAHFAGYIGGMGLGYTHDQGLTNLFNLQRRDVKGTYDVKQFASFLPWQGDAIFLPTDTPTPTMTPTRTPIPTYTWIVPSTSTP
ncbi:MAG TPA: polysaccharide deacetylase family protein [Anaerolineales bacterium]|nr:polysaccharide deacetylase family protein [Anaerolineales bacterium]HMX19665.1 polysaccharide deacetylase family protein [Anaerolineales bacterium]HNF35186.1 polysaccharide deacetylase family protein [Anaerolineales bacterium]